MFGLEEYKTGRSWLNAAKSDRSMLTPEVRKIGIFLSLAIFGGLAVGWASVILT